MATPNIQVILQQELTATNNLESPAPYIANVDLGNPTLDAANFYYNAYFPAPISPAAKSVPIDVAAVFCIVIKNLSPTGVLIVTPTPTTGFAFSMSIGPGGVFSYIDPTEDGGGFSALALSGVTVVVPALVFVAY